MSLLIAGCDEGVPLLYVLGHVLPAMNCSPLSSIELTVVLVLDLRAKVPRGPFWDVRQV